MGATSQVSALAAAATIAAILLFLTGPIQYLPSAVLGTRGRAAMLMVPVSGGGPEIRRISGAGRFVREDHGALRASSQSEEVWAACNGVPQLAGASDGARTLAVSPSMVRELLGGHLL